MAPRKSVIHIGFHAYEDARFGVDLPSEERGDTGYVALELTGSGGQVIIFLRPPDENEFGRPPGEGADDTGREQVRSLMKATAQLAALYGLDDDA